MTAQSVKLQMLLGEMTLPDREHTTMIGPFSADEVQMMDCIEGMKLIPHNSVDVVIADPPYNTSKGNVWKWDNSVKLSGFGGAWSTIMEQWDDLPLTDYFSFTYAWLKEVKRILRPTGSRCRLVQN